MSSKLCITILTLGENVDLLARVQTIKEFFDNSNIDYVLKLSVNSRDGKFNSEPYGNLIDEIVEYPNFLDSVEEHLYSYLLFEKKLEDSVTHLLPISDNDNHDIDLLIKLVNKVMIAKIDLVFMNHSFGSKLGISSERSICIFEETSILSSIVNNSGLTHGAAKLGAWIFSKDILKTSEFDIWGSWLESSILFSHSYFFFAISLKSDVKTLFANENYISTEVNPTDIDRSSVWLDYYQRTGKLFQQDWTFGQLYYLKILREQGLIDDRKIRNAIISCSQRGVLPLIYDICWRIVINQSKQFLQKSSLINVEFIYQNIDFLEDIWPEFSQFANQLKVLVNSTSNASQRLFAYKFIHDFIIEMGARPWAYMKIHDFKAFEIYERTDTYVGIRKGLNVNIVMRDSSQQLCNDSVFHSKQISEVENWIESHKPTDYHPNFQLETWVSTKMQYFVKMPKMQIFLIKNLPPRQRQRVMNVLSKIMILRNIRQF